MRLSKKEHRKKVVLGGLPVILFNIGETKFALDASEVDEIRTLEGLAPFTPVRGPSRLAKVKYTIQRQGATYFVVDAGMPFGILSAKPTRVMLLRNSLTAVLVDSIDRMSELSSIKPLPLAFTGSERNWYLGLGLRNEEVLPLVNASVFLTKAEIVLLQNMLDLEAGKRRESQVASV